MNCLENTRKFVFLGETGSGKTELSVNWAIHLAKNCGRRVCFFDMDQTKGLFRARDLKELLEAEGVEVLETIQFQDSPVVPQGVTGVLEDPESICVFDVGGNAVGARMVGQYARYLEDGWCLYVLNPNRPFSDEASELQDTMEWILKAGRVPHSQVHIISNPCLGDQTTAETVVDGHRRLRKLLREMGREPSMLTVETTLAQEVQKHVECPVYPIRLYVKQLYCT